MCVSSEVYECVNVKDVTVRPLLKEMYQLLFLCILLLSGSVIEWNSSNEWDRHETATQF
jgi:hypothetical protein